MNHIRMLLLMAFSHSIGATANTEFSYQSYNPADHFLRFNIITPSIHGQLILRKDKNIITLKNVQIENLFTLRVKIPCAQLGQYQYAYWNSVQQPVLIAELPQIRCTPTPLAIKPSSLQLSDPSCQLNLGGQTLWRLALTLSAQYDVTIHQALLAVFFKNQKQFINKNINKLKTELLQCPTEAEYHARSAPLAKKQWLAMQL